MEDITQAIIQDKGFQKVFIIKNHASDGVAFVVNENYWCMFLAVLKNQKRGAHNTKVQRIGNYYAVYCTSDPQQLIKYAVFLNGGNEEIYLTWGYFNGSELPSAVWLTVSSTLSYSSKHYMLKHVYDPRGPSETHHEYNLEEGDYYEIVKTPVKKRFECLCMSYKVCNVCLVACCKDAKTINEWGGICQVQCPKHGSFRKFTSVEDIDVIKANPVLDFAHKFTYGKPNIDDAVSLYCFK